MSDSITQPASGGGSEVVEEDGHLDALPDVAGVGAAPDAPGDQHVATDTMGERLSEDVTPDGTVVDQIIPVAGVGSVDEFMASLPDDVLIEPINEVFEETDD